MVASKAAPQLFQQLEKALKTDDGELAKSTKVRKLFAKGYGMALFSSSTVVHCLIPFADTLPGQLQSTCEVTQTLTALCICRD